jgi:ribosomal protein S14
MGRDAENYTRPDSGCEKATQFLQRQSKCLECPFWPDIKDCVFDRDGRAGRLVSPESHVRLMQIAKVEGTVSGVARQFGVSRDTVRRAKTLYAQKLPAA